MGFWVTKLVQLLSDHLPLISRSAVDPGPRFLKGWRFHGCFAEPEKVHRRITHADLARIFAAGSMKYERESPGPLARMSEHHGQVAVNPPAYGYMGRQMDRALSKNPVESWSALLMQAARLSQLMAENQFGGNRPRLGAVNTALATVVIADAQKELGRQAERVASRQTARPQPIEQQTSSEESGMPGYMSAAEYAQLKSALGKRTRLSPTAGTNASRPRPEHLRRDPGRDQDQGRER